MSVRTALPLLAVLLLCVIVAPANAATPKPYTGAEAPSPSLSAHRTGATFLLGLPVAAAPARVCLVDSGTAATPDTTAVVGRVSVVGADVDDQAGHGTEMAAVIAAAANDVGTVGVAPGSVQIISVRASADQEPRARFSDAATSAAIDWCTAHAAELNLRVINMSLGGPQEGDQERTAIQRAHDAGLVLVGSAGNDPAASVGFPAADPNVIAVSGFGADGRRCGFATFGAQVALMAPGCVREAKYDGVADYADGTSAAAAYVSGAIAALLTYRPDLTTAAVTDLFVRTRRPDLGLQVDRAFAAAGLAELVAQGMRDAPLPPLTYAAQQQLQEDAERRQIPPAITGIQDLGRRVHLVVARRPAGAWLKVTLYRGHRNGPAGRVLGARRTQRNEITINNAQGWGQLDAEWVDARGRPFSDDVTSCSHTAALDREFGGPCRLPHL